MLDKRADPETDKADRRMLMGMIKYRVHEVAKDFNTTSKVISQIGGEEN